MHIPDFATEQFFARYEFTTPYLLCASDCETMSVADLLALAGRDTAELGGLRLGYGESAGDPALRAAIARLYETVPPAAIVALGAPEEGIYVTMRALLSPGDHVIVLSPAYDSLRHLARHIGAAVDDWPIVAENGRWHLDLGRLQALLTRRTRLVIVNFPHNPTGLLPTAGECAELLAMVEQSGAWLFSDEMYRGLEFDPAAPQLPSAADRSRRSVVLSGLSKVYGLPGLRSGWLVVHDPDLRERLINWKHYTTICAAAPSEYLAQVALSVAEPLAERSRGLVRENVAAASSFFARWPEQFVWRRPQAGSVALVKLTVPSATVYCHELARDAGILLLPGPHLGASDRFVRFGLGRADFAANLTRLETHLIATA